MLTAIPQAYHFGIVMLSICIAMVASYAALDVAGRVHASHGRTRSLWAAGGAFAMGTGIWSMHFVGMLALRLPILVSYSLASLGLSISVAIVASLFALWIAGRANVRHFEMLAAAVAMGLAIAGMHYIGMAGMQMSARILYDGRLVSLSLAIAVAASYVALQLARRLRSANSRRGAALRGVAAVIMGFAIAGMHYTGMAAANLMPMPDDLARHDPGMAPMVVAILVGVGGTCIAGIAIIASMLDRLLKARVNEATLRAERNIAERTTRAMSEFLANMSHELRTPLNSIIGFSKILQKNKTGNLRATDITHVERIVANGTHLLGLINGILDLSKIEAGRIDLDIESLDLASLIRETVDLLQPQAKPGVELASEAATDVGQLRGDRVRLKQIIINLVGNALKFTETGLVTVRLVVDVRNGAPARIDVIDTGIGIPADRQAAVFDAFRQADSTTSRTFGGTGLGLTITRSLAELMGWTITVQSEPGVGSTFSVQFASDAVTLVAPRQPAAATTARAASSSAHQRLRVLVIDDEQDSRTLIQHEFDEEDCELFFAECADEGMALARRIRPDLILLDIMMPGKSGLTALAEMKADPELHDIPVVIVSVVADEARAKANGAMAVIRKPFTRADIADLIVARELMLPRLTLLRDEPDSRIA